MYGPTLEASEAVHSLKYRQEGESFKEMCNRIASSLSDGEEHYRQFRDILLDMRFLPAGRVQAAVGAARQVTPYNCYVSGTIEDSMNDIMDKAKEAATTMRMGGGIGYGFSTIRPNGSRIVSLDSSSSGPISFMGIYDSVCNTVRSAGHRRGAQMGVLRVDHPDIEEFIRAKQNTDNLTNFNISVAVTDEFMEALDADAEFELRFEGRIHKKVKASYLWEEIMRSNWDWGEPGVLFIDRINQMNNLRYCEEIAATNPCGEQPLPPYGACLLGSLNLTRYIKLLSNGEITINYPLMEHDIVIIHRAMDNIIDQAIYPLPAQEEEAKSKRRMGIGITGLANTLERLDCSYGSPEAIQITESIMMTLRNTIYQASVSMAIEKGAFPKFHTDYSEMSHIRTLPKNIQRDIEQYGIRNSHLTSVAPTGTISFCADNVSASIEPPFMLEGSRLVNMEDGIIEMPVSDYAYREWGVKGKTADEVTAKEHVKMLTTVQKYVDSAVSKTCNVKSEMNWEDFKGIYWDAYKGGAKGCTTFRSDGHREGILKEKEEENGAACYIDPTTGERSCED